MTFEEEIAGCSSLLEPTLKSAGRGATAAKNAGKMLSDGNIKNISKRLEEAEQELSRAALGFREFRDRWLHSGVHDYFGTQEYFAELLKSLEEAQVDCHRLDQVLYVYPALVRLDPDGKAVRIDKKSYATVHPRKLADILRKIQTRPSRFPAARFLRSLFKVYKALASSNVKRSEWVGKSLYLRDIYNVMSATPGSDYSEQEFVRDVYLLDACGEPLEVSGHIATLEAGSATRVAGKTLEINTRDRQRRLYCTIRFDPVKG